MQQIALQRPNKLFGIPLLQADTIVDARVSAVGCLTARTREAALIAGSRVAALCPGSAFGA